MDAISKLLKRKPLFFIVASLAYLLLVGLAKWQLNPPVYALVFVLGGIFGIYFLDAAEVFFDLSPSPFRSILFAALFMLVSLFVVTSSGSFLASGLVLSLYFSMILWQVGEWQMTGGIESWFGMWATPVARSIQRIAMVVFALVFVLETVFFIR